MRWVSARAALLLLLSGCGGPAVTTPTLSGLMFGPTFIPVGQTTAIVGFVHFSAPHGDLTTMNITVTAPDGSNTAAPPSDLSATQGEETGAISFTINLTAPIAGAYFIKLSVVDSAGQTSNEVAGEVDTN